FRHVSACSRCASEQAQRVSAATQVARFADDLDCLASPLCRFGKATTTQLVVKHPQPIQVPALGASVAEPPCRLDCAVKQDEPFGPGAAKRKHITQTMGQVQDRLVED